MRGRPLTWGVVALVAAVVGFGSVVLWMAITRRGDLVPAPPWIALVTMLLLASFVLLLARSVRAHVRGVAKEPLDRLRAARILVLTQAAALTGGAGVGWYAGQIAVLLRDIGLVANHERAWRVGVALLCALLLAGAGMLGQHWCKVPPRPEEPAGSAGSAGSAGQGSSGGSSTR